MHQLRVIKNQEIIKTEDDIKRQFQDELISDYKKVLPIKLAKSTVPNVQSALSNYIPWLQDNELYIWEVEPDNYDSFVQHLSMNIAKSTIKNYNCHLSNLHDWLVSRKKTIIKQKFGVVVTNPIDYFNTPRYVPEDNHLPELPNEEIVNYYFQKERSELQKAKESKNRRQVYLIGRQLIAEQIMLKAGLRVDEVSKLNINNIDFENMKIIVLRGKGDKDRIVDLSDSLAVLIKWYIEQIYPLFNKKVSMFESVPLFVSERKARLSKKTIQSKMWEQQEEYNITIDQRFSPHGLRRLFATNLYKELYVEKHPDPLFYVKSQLGHVYISTTLKYCRIPQEFFFRHRNTAIESIRNRFEDKTEGGSYNDN